MEQKERPRQRLVLCLDGTWNQRDSGTNVYHLSNLIAEGPVGEEGWLQHVYYQEGVGTGVLDRVTGGAFGIGLSRNVREAYDWLVESYCDGDEIYVFGFSRGAFTARSLVGLISKCGLLRRGAPIPPEELWHGYQILGRQPSARSGMKPSENWWERIFGKRKPPFRELQVLSPPATAWERQHPLPLEKPANRAERLLVEWSRRVPIHCVGVYDTVGALGLNALALPWLRDKTVQFHDARLTSLVTNGFQALAIDEHRANFAHIPWYRETSLQVPSGQTVNGGAMEQRWFTGAHSNVGGGYEDDVLSQRTLAWMIETTSGLGLVFHSTGGCPDPSQAPAVPACRPLVDPVAGAADLADQAPALRDSFREFAGGIWQHFVRAKRAYRRMGPPPELQNGKRARSLNETLDEGVLELAKAEPRYTPPNLWRYLEERGASLSPAPPPHRYAEASGRWWAGLVFWLGMIALAGWKLGGPLNAWLALLAPLTALLVDWRESILNHESALEPEGLEAERRQAWLDVYLGLRLVAVAAAAVGVVLLALEPFRPWLRPDLPIRPSLGWLLGLGVLWVVFQMMMAWEGGPMTDAGLGSVFPLQRQRTPEGVRACLARWAGDGRGEKEPRQVLMPVVRGLWRDMLGFIPAYTALLFLGSWLALSLLQGRFHYAGDRPFPILLGLLSSDPRVWLPALAGALLCALADYVEDWGELLYVRTFPERPSSGAVRITFAATAVKMLLFTVGLALAILATVGLALAKLYATLGLVLGRIGLASGQPWTGHAEDAGTASAVAAVVALALVYAQVSTFWKTSTQGKRVRPAAPAAPPAPALSPGI